jgi:O-antigen/teichoic acid export membrane protein
MLIASPLFLTIIFFPGRVMALFGPGFEQGGDVLAILAVGQFVNAYTGSVGFVLMMGGRESEAWKALLYSVLTSVVLCLLLIPLLGARGCAVGVMVAEVLKNAMLVKSCKDQFGIVPIPLFGRGRREK